MDKGAPSGLFANDGSFMERFKQLQEKNGKEEKNTTLEESKPPKILYGVSSAKPSSNKTTLEVKGNVTTKARSASGGKLAFSLKPKSKIMTPAVKLGGDEDEEDTDVANIVASEAPVKRQKLDQPNSSEQSLRQKDVAPPPPSDLTVKNVADKLASFVAKNGRQFEHITRQKNPGDTPFKFLFDENSTEYKYYEYRLTEEEKALQPVKESQTPRSGSASTSVSKSATVSHGAFHQQSGFQIPASALYDASEEPKADSSGPRGSDPIAMMEFYMKKAAQEEKRRQPKQSKDEMPPPASLQASSKRGHHMGDYIPQEELEKFMSKCSDVAEHKYSKEAADKAKIQADNVGHKLLSKMGWKEGEALGGSRKGIADPIMAGDIKTNNLGVGASQPGEVTPEDDIYEQYKKRMMLGYRHRPNPLNNPRKAYY